MLMLQFIFSPIKQRCGFWNPAHMVVDLCHVVLSCFRREKAPRENPPNGDFFVFSHGDLLPRHTKVRQFSCVAFSPLFVVSLPGGAKSRHAKTRQSHHLVCFRVTTFRPARQRYDKQGRTRKRSPRQNPPNVDFFVFSHGDLSPRHTKVRDILCVAFSATVCRIFAWRGTFWRVFAWRPFAFSPRKHVYTTWHTSATIGTRFPMGSVSRC